MQRLNRIPRHCLPSVAFYIIAYSVGWNGDTDVYLLELLRYFRVSIVSCEPWVVTECLVSEETARMSMIQAHTEHESLSHSPRRNKVESLKTSRKTQAAQSFRSFKYPLAQGERFEIWVKCVSEPCNQCFGSTTAQRPAAVDRDVGKFQWWRDTSSEGKKEPGVTGCEWNQTIEQEWE